VAHTCKPTEEAEIRRIAVQSQPGKYPISKKTHHKKKGGREGQREWLKV
jgi:transposase-like protein